MARGLLDQLGLPASDAPPVARRPAFPQWCAEPVAGRRIAVGDAALASDPIAGQGLRFAMASAIAATNVAEVLDDPDRGDQALTYYREFVTGAVRRHLSLRTRLYLNEGNEPAARKLPEWVRWSGRTRVSPVNVEGVIVPATVLELPDGGLVRWLGSFDLLHLRELAPVSTPLTVLLRSLAARGLDAGRILGWCLRNDVLVGAEPGVAGDLAWPPDAG
jgi:hypothetical protein